MGVEVRCRVMDDQRPSFESKQEAEAFCGEREREEPDSSWLPFEAAGRWTAVRTNLPRHEEPLGTATEAKPKPPQADDPRPPLTRDISPRGPAV